MASNSAVLTLLTALISDPAFNNVDTVSECPRSLAIIRAVDPCCIKYEGGEVHN